jgi:hypothetical protein
MFFICSFHIIAICNLEYVYATLKEFLDRIKRFSEGDKAKATVKPHPYAAIQLSRIGRYINGTATHHEIQTIGGKHRGVI